MKITACLSHNSDDWKTPTEIYNKFMKAGYIDCFKYQSEEDETKNEYKNQKLFINPPFSKMKQITPWIIKQARKNIVALLIPARTDTNYFHELIKLHPTIYFIKGRLHYNDSNCAPFPILLVFNPDYVILKMPFYIGIEQENI